MNEKCEDCPPKDYPTNKTRCLECPERVRGWVEENAHMLVALSPLDIVFAWEERRKRAQQELHAEAMAEHAPKTSDFLP